MPAQPTSRSASSSSDERLKSPVLLFLFATGILLTFWMAGGGFSRRVHLALAQAPQTGPLRVTKTADPTSFVGSAGQSVSRSG